MLTKSRILRLGLFWIAFALSTSTVFAQNLDLADRPLLSGVNVPPNILVAVDDSGSMDFETLFPTDSGLLYWDGNRSSTWTGSGFVQSSNNAYAYLFPNGYNGSDRDRRIYSNYYAAPPIPAFAFARSPAYNSAYFDPSVPTYDPWLGKPNSSPTNAPADPVTGSHRLNLTQVLERTDDGYTFAVFNNTPFGNVRYADLVCVRFSFFGCREYGYEWKTSSSTATFNNNQLVPISYFPATFYLPSNIPLPASFGWKSGSPTRVGHAPNGDKTLTGYEIKPGNFVSTAAYNKAIQNFANWYTYYRKRHLATRAGVVAAFDEISGVRVGACTINQANQNSSANLVMRNLGIENSSQPDGRADFYSQVFNTDFSQARGTPNRPALKYLGEQLRNNSNIIQSACQRNFAILFTDGYNTSSVSGVDNADLNSRANARYGAPFGDNESNSIADVAMQYYENLGRVGSFERNQLRVPAGCGDARPDPWLDCETDLHMVTLGVTLGQRGVLFDPNQNYTDERIYRDNKPNWSALPNLNNFGSEQIDDLWHATINSRGKLLNARTPVEVASAFTGALDEILNQDGSFGGVALNSRSLSSESLAFQATYSGSDWSGDLKTFRLSNSGVAQTPVWKASEKIPSPGNRVVLTATANGGKYTGKAFRPSVLESLYATLNLNADKINYLRGDRTQERSKGGPFRNRGDHVLGDIVQSTPAYVAEPKFVRYPTVWKDKHLEGNAGRFPENGSAYSNPGGNGFAQQQANRTPMVYVGANDGMLHGFEASSGVDGGVERLAYVPGTLLDDVGALTQPEYTHRYYVDGSPATGDAFFGGKWRSVLVGGMNNGGNAIYALDITDPDNFSEANASSTVLWEYTASGALGQTYGKPSISRLHNGDWAALFGNGYNSAGRSASLHIVRMADGEPIRSAIDTNSAPAASAYPNGLSEVTPIDVDNDFIIDYVYAGDLYGNMWRFDLTSKSSSEWSVKKLFTARGPGGSVQPITMAPQVGVHPYGPGYGVMVYFGTGKYLEKTDALFNAGARNSFYGVWDADVFSYRESSAAKKPSPSANFTRANLQQQTVTNVKSGDTTYRVVSDNPVSYDTGSSGGDGQRGWFMDMPSGSGELLINTPTLVGDLVVFTTLVPPEQTCTLEATGAIMAVRADTGGRTERPIFDLDGNRKHDSADLIGGDNDKVAPSGIVLGTSSPVGGLGVSINDDGTVQVNSNTSDGGNIAWLLDAGQNTNQRVSWREIRR
ncbi:type IV fimbrial biogenesis protein PilY1 [Salinisphaera sp. C84B14]|uniref:pilus assembly protein n=1 Tax=Salinisphaera sp. C84B14 TaxID=1304155 RepID=UPI00333E6645